MPRVVNESTMLRACKRQVVSWNSDSAWFHPIWSGPPQPLDFPILKKEDFQNGFDLFDPWTDKPMDLFQNLREGGGILKEEDLQKGFDLFDVWNDKSLDVQNLREGVGRSQQDIVKVLQQPTSSEHTALRPEVNENDNEKMEVNEVMNAESDHKPGDAGSSEKPVEMQVYVDANGVVRDAAFWSSSALI